MLCVIWSRRVCVYVCVCVCLYCRQTPNCWGTETARATIVWLSALFSSYSTRARGSPASIPMLDDGRLWMLRCANPRTRKIGRQENTIHLYLKLKILFDFWTNFFYISFILSKIFLWRFNTSSCKFDHLRDIGNQSYDSYLAWLMARMTMKAKTLSNQPLTPLQKKISLINSLRHLSNFHDNWSVNLIFINIRVNIFFPWISRDLNFSRKRWKAQKARKVTVLKSFQNIQKARKVTILKNFRKCKKLERNQEALKAQKALEVEGSRNGKNKNNGILGSL